MNLNENNISKFNLYMLMVLFTIVFVVIILTTISLGNKKFETVKNNIEKKYINDKKNDNKKKVNSVNNLIKVHYETRNKRLREYLKLNVSNAYKIIENIYSENASTKTNKEILEIIKSALRQVRFKNGRGYFFIDSLNGINILYPSAPEYENTNILNLQDSQGNFIVKDEFKLIKEKGEGFIDSYWPLPNDSTNKSYEKLTFIKEFKPLNITIGLGEYLYYFNEDFKNDILVIINSLNKNANNEDYIFIFDFISENIRNNNFLSHPSLDNDTREDDNVPYFNIKEFLRDHKKDLLDKKDLFKKYNAYRLEGERKLEKISYLLLNKNLNWVIGSGFYLNDLEKTILEKEKELKNITKDEIIVEILIMFFFLALLFIFIVIINNKTNSIILNYKIKVKKREEELIIQKQQSESILSSILLPMIITSKKNRKIVYANSFAEKTYETTLSELINLDIGVLYSDDNQKKMISNELKHKGIIQNLECKFKTLSNNEFDGLLSLLEINYNGEECLLSVVTDISEQKKIEEEIRLKQTQMRILVDAIPSMIFMKDKEGRYLLVNEIFTKSKDLLSDDILGKTNFDIMPYEIAKNITAIDKEVMNSKKTLTQEIAVPTKNGKMHYYLMSKVPLLEDKGDISGMVGISTDITELKELQKEIEKMHNHIRESIEYASLIQHSIISDNNELKYYFDEYFTIWHPKDIVGGDMYLFEDLRNENECLLMIIDCTGHGVPGAFMTMLVKAIEREIIGNIVTSTNDVSPAKILQEFNVIIKKLLKQESKDSISDAGFDGGVLYYNKAQNYIKYSGARTPLFYIQNDKLKMIKTNRHSIGYKKSDVNFVFDEYKIEIDTQTRLYISTDGYFDQTGGKKGFPFGISNFKKFLIGNYTLPFVDQQELLLYKMQEYQKDEERNDDITLLGLKLSPNTKKKDVISWDI